MPEFSSADHGLSPPRIVLPSRYNAAHDLLERNLASGRGDKLAYIDDDGAYTYAALSARVQRAANALTTRGLQPGDRIIVALHDTLDFPSVFLGAIRAGIVPIAINTMLTSADYRFMLNDSGAKALIVSAPLLSQFEAALAESQHTPQVIVAGGAARHADHQALGALLSAASPQHTAIAMAPDAPCFWLYSSGSTGTPKGTVHIHSSLMHTAELYARPILGITEHDRVFSAAKLFFAYGLGNSLTFPLAVGATTVLMAERPTPEAVFRRLLEQQPTIFYGVPTLYASMLASNALPSRNQLNLRVCTSAGEALPSEIGQRFRAHFGVDILDGIGSTEMLHIFMSNQVGDVRYGTTGKPVPGYRVKLCDEHGAEIAGDGLGELLVSGPTSAITYWNNPAKSAATFAGGWTRTGDKYTRNAAGYYVYGGRADDMLKVSGQYVSPFEVEAALATHPKVLEAAVIGVADETALVKPKAYVVLKPGFEGSPELEQALQAHVKAHLAAHKYPRWIEFVTELPKTATGKIQRFKLRAAAESAREP